MVKPIVPIVDNKHPDDFHHLPNSFNTQPTLINGTYYCWDDYGYSEESFQHQQKHYYTGYATLILLLPLMFVTIWRLVAHIKMKSAPRRILFHILLLLAILCQIPHGITLSLLSSNFCFADEIKQYTRVGKFISRICESIALIFIMDSWSRIVNVITSSSENMSTNNHQIRRILILSIYTLLIILQSIAPIYYFYNTFSFHTRRHRVAFSLNDKFYQFSIIVNGNISCVLAASFAIVGLCLRNRLKKLTITNVLPASDVHTTIWQMYRVIISVTVAYVLRASVYILYKSRRINMPSVNGDHGRMTYNIGHSMAPMIITFIAYMWLERRKLTKKQHNAPPSYDTTMLTKVRTPNNTISSFQLQHQYYSNQLSCISPA